MQAYAYIHTKPSLLILYDGKGIPYVQSNQVIYCVPLNIFFNK